MNIRRRMLYYRRRNLNTLHVGITLSILAMFGCATIFFANRVISPEVVQLAVQKGREAISEAILQTIREDFNGKIEYEELANIERSEDMKISAIEVNAQRLNHITSVMKTNIYRKLQELNKKPITISSKIFNGILQRDDGINFHITLVPEGEVEADFESDFLPMGGDRMKHMIYLQIKAKLCLRGPIISKVTELEVLTPLTETVLIGEIPLPYMNTWKSIEE